MEHINNGSSIFDDTMAHMKWTEIQQHVNNNAIVLLPLGVIEEHGPHLCAGTDILVAHHFCIEVKKQFKDRAVIIAPPFYWGVCQSTDGFIGSFKIRKETATALLTDILSSLADFGFKDIFGISYHGDIEHNLAIIDAFKAACEGLHLNARYAFNQQRLTPYGLSEEAQFLCVIPPSDKYFGASDVPDAHAGDLETAVLQSIYPQLMDEQAARASKPVRLQNSDTEAWLFGGHIHDLSPQGYLGDPAKYQAADAHGFINDYALRVADAIYRHIS